MAYTGNFQINIDNQTLEIGERQQVGLRYSYTLEESDNFLSKGGGNSLGLQIPSSPHNDAILNQFYNSNVEDMSGTGVYGNYRACQIIVNGVELLTGSAVMRSGSHTRMGENYEIDAYNQNSDWVIQAQDVTLWDCLNPTIHNFDVATIEKSWDDAISGGFDSDEDHDFVYAPVRYRQPFGDNDDSVNIYHLRPAISIYWLIIRGFRMLGWTIKSNFMNTPAFFRRLVLLWTWGDFFDINSQLTSGVGFKAYGKSPLPAPTSSTPPPFYIAGGTYNAGWGYVNVSGTGYVITSGYGNFFMGNTSAPEGYDNFHLYSFDETTGTMKYTYNPPASLSAFLANNTTLNFTLTLLIGITGISGGQVDVQLEVSKNGTIISTSSVLPGGGPFVGGGHYPGGSFITSPTVFNFSVAGVNRGDILTFRIKYAQSGTLGATLVIAQTEYIDVNPSSTGANNWQYNPVTQKWAYINGGSDPVWQLFYSTLELTGVEIAVGSPVNLQNYDKFRSYKWLDLIRGMIDMFNWSIQSDPISRQVVIEPTHDYVLPDGTRMDGYFKKERIDWSLKQDVSKENLMQLFSSAPRQLDFSFKGDGADGAQNIYTARYKGIYLNNKLINSVNTQSAENGIVSAIPGASRYILPGRFPLGEQQNVNRFFSATMHYQHTKWLNINELLGGAPSDDIAPQLICIIPENINDTSASAVSATFEPKIAFYSGKQPLHGVGGWRWQGDPFGRGTDSNGVGIPTYNDPSDAIAGQPLSTLSSIGFQLPYIFAVDYTGYVGTAPGTMPGPILSYSNQLINGVVKPGLMKTYFLKRLAMMRKGKIYKPWMNLDLGDIIDWTHQNAIIINNALYNLIGIDNFDPLSDDSCQCVLWKEADPEALDVVNSFPSDISILTNPSLLAQFDLKYAPLLIFPSDLPQVG